MNRQTKRLLAKQEKQAERERARQAPLSRGGGQGGTGGGPGGGGGGGRGGGGGGGGSSRGGEEKREGRIKRGRRFLHEVRQELRKVAWPTRAEVATYTVVVLVSVTFVTLLVFGLDTAFGEAAFELYEI